MVLITKPLLSAGKRAPVCWSTSTCDLGSDLGSEVTFLLPVYSYLYSLSFLFSRSKISRIVCFHCPLHFHPCLQASCCPPFVNLHPSFRPFYMCFYYKTNYILLHYGPIKFITAILGFEHLYLVYTPCQLCFEFCSVLIKPCKVSPTIHQKNLLRHKALEMQTRATGIADFVSYEPREEDIPLTQGQWKR